MDDINFSCHQMDLMLVLLLVISSLITRFVFSDMNQLICDGVIYFEKYYEKQLLFGTLHEPTNLVMHSKSGNLFFTHKVHKLGHMYSAIRVCNINTKKCKDIKEVKEGRAIAYDTYMNTIYLGGRGGIYKYNFIDETAHLYAEKGISIWNLYVRYLFFYVEDNTKRLFMNFTYFEVLPNMEDVEVDNFYIATDHLVYYSNSSGLYTAADILSKTVVLNNTMRVRQISEDFYDKKPEVFFATVDGLYIQDVVYPTMIKVAEIEDVYGVTFRNVTKHRSEIIYSDQNAIYALKPSKHAYTCLKKLHAQKLASRSLDLRMTVSVD